MKNIEGNKAFIVFTTNSSISPECEVKYATSSYKTFVKSVIGCYKGVIEQSLVVSMGGETDDAKTFQRVVATARAFKQKYLLLVDTQRVGWLIDCKTLEEKCIGNWREVSPMKADTLDCYTKDGAKYWACV